MNVARTWTLEDSRGCWAISGEPPADRGSAGPASAPPAAVLASPCNYAALAEIYEQVLQQQLPRPPTTLDVDRMIAQLQQALDRGALSA